MTGINLRPMVTAELMHRIASSHCCGAPLMMLARGERAPGTPYACRKCGNACMRVLSEPVVITAHG
jgi:hypothetical protein